MAPLVLAAVVLVLVDDDVVDKPAMEDVMAAGWDDEKEDQTWT